jgi:pimeloyl-ACP methyl ester carboxylesterase
MKPTGLALWAAGVVLLGIALLVAITLMQDRLIYFPTRYPLAEAKFAGLQAWPSAHDFRGFARAPDGPARATAIVFHGNAGHAGDRGYYAETLARLGLRVILAEYPGYGPREGALGERSLVADAAASIALAHRLHGAPLLVIGESLGAGVAAAAAAHERDKVAGLLLITPWDRLESVAAHHYPWLPVRGLLRDRYDTAANLAAFGRPVLVVVATGDEVVPARLGRALHAALAEPKRLAVLEGAGHNDWPAQLDAAWWERATAFLLGL